MYPYEHLLQVSPFSTIVFSAHLGALLHGDVSVKIIFSPKWSFILYVHCTRKHKFTHNHQIIYRLVNTGQRNKCLNDIRLSTPAQNYVTKCFPSEVMLPLQTNKFGKKDILSSLNNF